MSNIIGFIKGNLNAIVEDWRKANSVETYVAAFLYAVVVIPACLVYPVGWVIVKLIKLLVEELKPEKTHCSQGIPVQCMTDQATWEYLAKFIIAPVFGIANDWYALWNIDYIYSADEYYFPLPDAIKTDSEAVAFRHKIEYKIAKNYGKSMEEIRKNKWVKIGEKLTISASALN